MNFKFFRSFFSVVFIGFLLTPTFSFAAQQLGDSLGIGDEETGIFGSCLSPTDIRTGNVTMDKIPCIIVNSVETLLLLVGTICVVAIIYHAVRMQLASGILGDSSGVDKAKKGIYSALMGFILSMSAWFIMTKLVSIFAGIT